MNNLINPKMNRTILYYPTIDIPDKSWLSNAVLYWDEVSSIVPQSYDDRILTELSREVHYLMGEGQFRPMKPETLMHQQNGWEESQLLRQEFEEIVNSPAYQVFLDVRFSKRGQENYKWSTIHSNKISYNIYQFLLEKGLAKPGDDRGYDERWVLFESRTALLYMSLLAKYLADSDGEQTVIGTNKSNYEKFNFKPTTKSSGFPVIRMNINDVLPTASPGVAIEKIVAFKRKRVDNLRHFKKIISDFQSKISNAKSQAEIKEAAINFEETLINGVTDLRHTLKDAKIDCVFKSLKSLVNLKSPTSFVAAAAVVNSKFPLVKVSLDSTALGLGAAAALELTFQYIDTRNKARAKLRESPFSYVYRASELGFLNKNI